MGFVLLPADLKEMCELLGIEQSVLERAFSYRTVEAKLEKVSTTLNVAQVGGETCCLSPFFFFAPVPPVRPRPTCLTFSTRTLTHTHT